MRKQVTTNLDEGVSNWVSKPGKYVFVVSATDQGIEFETEARMKLEVLRVVSGKDNADQVGKQAELRIEFFPNRDDPKIQQIVDRKIKTATSALQMTEAIRKQTATLELWKGWEGQEVDFNFEEADGRVFAADVEMQEYDKKDRETGQPTGEKGHASKILWYTMQACDTAGNIIGSGGGGGGNGGNNGAGQGGGRKQSTAAQTAPAAKQGTTGQMAAAPAEVDPWASVV